MKINNNKHITTSFRCLELLQWFKQSLNLWMFLLHTQQKNIWRCGSTCCVKLKLKFSLQAFVWHNNSCHTKLKNQIRLIAYSQTNYSNPTRKLLIRCEQAYFCLWTIINCSACEENNHQFFRRNLISPVFLKSSSAKLAIVVKIRLFQLISIGSCYDENHLGIRNNTILLQRV